MTLDLENLLRIAEVIFGVGLIIFVHELGHFLVARKMGVRVETFALGFGPRLLGFRRDLRGRLRFTLGGLGPRPPGTEAYTDYRVSLVPLGGYVKMVGELPDGDQPLEGRDYEFPSKSVGQRAAILSAGVIMNALAAFAAFIVAFHFGVVFRKPVIGEVYGQAALDAGLQAGDVVKKVNGTPILGFDDLQTEVAYSDRDQPVVLEIERAGRLLPPLSVRLRRDEERGYNTIGVFPRMVPVVGEIRAYPGRPSPLQGPDGTFLLDVDDEVIAIDGRSVPDWEDFRRRIADSPGRPLALRIRDRHGRERDATVTPDAAGEWTIGLTHEWDGQVTFVEDGGVAARAGIKVGDVLRRIAGRAVSDPAQVVQPWGIRDCVQPCQIELQRGNGTVIVLVEPQWRERWDLPIPWAPDAPHAIRWVRPAGVAAGAGLQVGDVVIGVNGRELPWSEIHAAIRAAAGRELKLKLERAGRALEQAVTPKPGPDGYGAIGISLDRIPRVGPDPDGEASALGLASGDWVRAVDGREVSLLTDVQDALQRTEGRPAMLRVRRGGVELDVNVRARRQGWLGILPQYERYVVREGSVLGAVTTGCASTVQMVKRIFLTLRAIVKRDVAASNIGGPVLIAQVSYNVAKEGFWTLLYFLGMLSINLAVINAFPIPVLDGGHLLFLLIEKLKGSPVTERTLMVANYVGLFAILLLMVCVTYNDIVRLITS